MRMPLRRAMGEQELKMVEQVLAGYGTVANDLFALLRAGKRASYAELATDLGHDSFLLESEELYSLVRSFLERDQPYVFDYAI